MDLQSLFKTDQTFGGTKGLVFFDDTHVLVYERDSNTSFYAHHLDLPGGGSERNESPFETFARELKEEFALDVKPSAITYARTYPSMKDPAIPSWFLVARLPNISSTSIHFGSEGTRYAVMALDALLASPKIIPALRERIQGYLECTKDN